MAQRALLTVVLLLALAEAGTGQPTPGALKFSGSLRSRVESWDWFQGEADNRYAYSGSLLRLSLGQQRKDVDWQIEMAIPVLLGLPANATVPGPQGQFGLGAAYFVANDRSRNAALPFLKQGYLRFKKLGGSDAHSLRVGRVEFIEGTEVTPKNPTLATVKRDRIAHRLIGNFGFTHVGRSFDGVHYVFTTPLHNVTLLAARPTRGVFQVDGWGELDVAVFYGAYTRQLIAPKSSGELRGFVIQYTDWRDVLKTDNRSLAARRADRANVRVNTVGGHYLLAAERLGGVMDLLVWGAIQSGRWGTQDHRAAAVALEAGYQLPVWSSIKPWLRGGVYHGSGDNNPSDNKHGTFFQILPTARWYARFPFFNLMNNQDFFGQITVRPHPRLKLQSEVRSLRLSTQNDLWYLGGGAFQPWTFGFVGRPSNSSRGLATLFDLSADYEINSSVSVGAYFGRAQGKSVPASIYPRGPNASLGFVELGYRF
ncbi:MAG: alginate export family protein [Acidobacteriota bacterium]